MLAYAQEQAGRLSVPQLVHEDEAPSGHRAGQRPTIGSYADAGHRYVAALERLKAHAAVPGDRQPHATTAGG